MAIIRNSGITQLTLFRPSSICSLKRWFPNSTENATAFRTSSTTLAFRSVRNSAR
jgi:hypothetical protein